MMRRVIGFALFWVAVGMTLGLLIGSTFWAILIIIICLILGYNLFCVR